MMLRVLFCVATLLWWRPCAAASKLRGGGRRIDGWSNGVKGKRRLNKSNEGKITDATEAEALFYEEGARKGTPKNIQVGTGRVANYANPEQESRFYEGKAAEPKGSGNDNTDGGRSYRPPIEEAWLSHDDEEKEEAEAEEAKGNTADTTSSGFGRMEGHPLMQHNTDEAETIEETRTTQPGPDAAAYTTTVEDEGNGVAEAEHHFVEPVSPPSQSRISAYEQEQSESYALEEMAEVSVQTPSPTLLPVQTAVETTGVAPMMQEPHSETVVPTNQEIVEEMFLPDTDIVIFPTEADDSSNAANWLFGGNLVEPVSSFSDHPQQAGSISSATAVVEPLEPQEQTLQKEPTTGELEEKEPNASSNQRQQPTRDERAKRTAAMIMSGAGVCSLLLALTYLADYQRKRKQNADQKLELNFGGSQYETDTSSSKSTPSGGGGLSRYASGRRPYAVESVQYDHNANDACDVTSDPWSFENVENIEFGNTHSPGGHQIRGNISSTIDVYRKRIANYVPQGNYTIYEEFEESSSRASDPIFEDGGEDEYMGTYGKNFDQGASPEVQARLPQTSEAPGSEEEAKSRARTNEDS